jgi:hypothetical protein
VSNFDWCQIVFHIYVAAGIILSGTNGSWEAILFCFGFALVMMVAGIGWALWERKSRE